MTADQVLELYSVRDAAACRLANRACATGSKAGFLRPSVSQGGRFYTRRRPCRIKAAVELLGAGSLCAGAPGLWTACAARCPSGWRRPRACACSRRRDARRGRVTAPPTTRTPASWSCRSRCRRSAATWPVLGCGARRGARAGRGGRGRFRSDREQRYADRISRVPQAPSAGWDAPSHGRRRPTSTSGRLPRRRTGRPGAGRELLLARPRLEPSLAAGAHQPGATSRTGRLGRRRAALVQRALDSIRSSGGAFNLAKMLDEMGETDLALARAARGLLAPSGLRRRALQLGPPACYRVGGAAQAATHLGSTCRRLAVRMGAARQKDLLTACGDPGRGSEPHLMVRPARRRAGSGFAVGAAESR